MNPFKSGLKLGLGLVIGVLSPVLAAVGLLGLVVAGLSRLGEAILAAATDRKS